MSFSVSACGNSAAGPTHSEPPGNLVSQAEVDGYPKGSLEQAFLEYWSALQYQSWAEVASYYSPSLREFVRAASIIGAKRLNGPSYPTLKPSIAEVARHGDLMTVRYTVWLSGGTKELASVTWRKVGGNWQIVYDSRLDAELNQLAQNRVEMTRNGVLPTDLDEVSPEALRAGDAAAQSQARFVQNNLDLNLP
jgi:hypothetical protein